MLWTLDEQILADSIGELSYSLCWKAHVELHGSHQMRHWIVRAWNFASLYELPVVLFGPGVSFSDCCRMPDRVLTASNKR
jgi:hypothetical protein